KQLIDVAEENGIYIPTLCHFKGIYPPLGTCRVCTVSINGRMDTACTRKVFDGMNVEVNTPEILDNRKAIIEMLFAEGNHFCPACAKSGDCELQRKGYEMGISSSRFPHLFEERKKDFKPERIYMEHNRCILCKRCVQEVKTVNGDKVFYFQNKGHKMTVGIDYKREKELTDQQIIDAANLCPVGAIIAKGKTIAKPLGTRKFDSDKNINWIEGTDLDIEIPKDGKKKIVATTSLAGCFGCHMSLLDIDLGILDVLELVEFNKSPLTDIKKFTKQCDIGIIEGGVANSENFEVLREFRKKCNIIVALGECSIWGGMPAMRNTLPLKDCLEEAYLHSISSENDENIIPCHEDIPKLLDKVYSIHDIIKVDYYIPGCPPNAEHIWKMVKNILFGTKEKVEYADFKYD
ncbi:MAG: 2Fe-2S iron-sulfur cluster binding domain-containing protein, partial [Chlorobi bacterium]|nr:2Fe-2S iron-sulfur cluster binding domain-containing protein [Chlorobiota bacterium]